MKITTYYTILDNGLFGDTVVYHGKTLVAKCMNLSLLRRDAASYELMEGWIGFNMWRWLGIEVDRLPAGCTMEAIKTAYLVARDELADRGLAIPADAA